MHALIEGLSAVCDYIYFFTHILYIVMHTLNARVTHEIGIDGTDRFSGSTPQHQRKTWMIFTS